MADFFFLFSFRRATSKSYSPCGNVWYEFVKWWNEHTCVMCVFRYVDVYFEGFRFSKLHCTVQSSFAGPLHMRGPECRTVPPLICLLPHTDAWQDCSTVSFILCRLGFLRQLFSPEEETWQYTMTYKFVVCHGFTLSIFTFSISISLCYLWQFKFITNGYR